MTSAKPEDGPVRAEIQFFMDKTFQISLAYIVGLGTLFALANSALVNNFAQLGNMSTTALVACILLLLNVVYMTLAAACLFAVLKRGLFALTHKVHVSETWHRWEVFVRKESDWPVSTKFPTLAWNVDNYYTIPLNVLTLIMSALAAAVSFASKSPSAIAVGSVLCLLHLVPGWMLWQLKNLDDLCRRHISSSSADS